MAQEFLGAGWSYPLQFDARGRLVMAREEDAVRRSLWLVLATALGERVMRPEFGCGLGDLVFAPDVAKAPKGPYLIDLMSGERKHRMTFGLTMDFLGYIVPRYNWVLDEKDPWFSEAPGDHYEETNSIGPLAEPQIVGSMRQLIQMQ